MVINCELDGVVKPKTPDELEEIPDEWLNVLVHKSPPERDDCEFNRAPEPKIPDETEELPDELVKVL